MRGVSSGRLLAVSRLFCSSRTRLVDITAPLECSVAREESHLALHGVREKLEWFRRSPSHSRCARPRVLRFGREAALSSERPSALEPQTDFSGCSLFREAAFVVTPALLHRKQEQMPSRRGGGEAVNGRYACCRPPVGRRLSK